MKTYGLLGPAAPEAGWVPAPRYLLRRARILRQLAGIKPCQALEIGCGAGVLLHELTARGFDCSALESSAEARTLARGLATDAGIDIDFHEEAVELAVGQGVGALVLDPHDRRLADLPCAMAPHGHDHDRDPLDRRPLGAARRLVAGDLPGHPVPRARLVLTVDRHGRESTEARR